jgi:competence protein ComEC
MFLPSLMRLWKEDAPQRPLWVAVLFAAGCALYFTLPSEPSPYSLFAGFALIPFALQARRKAWHMRAMLLLALLLVCFGAAWAKFSADNHAPVMLERGLYPRPIEGVVEALEFLPTGIRITLAEVRIADWPEAKTPERVRLSLRVRAIPDVEVGARVQLRAGLLPPMGPILRGSFDFSRYFYFRDIGAVGYGLMPLTILEKAEPNGFLGFWQKARHHLTRDIRATLPGVEGAIASGLITGDDAAITPATYETLRATNLLHIIAISGAHMVVIGGVVFVALRLLFLTMPRFGLTPRAKQLAAAITLIALTAYLLITGVDISATRAYIMMALLLLSVMALREVQPMYSLALTAIIMLLYHPSDILEPGFQLSFAATMAMIAVVASQWKRGVSDLRLRMARLPFHAIAMFLLFSISAELATMPLVMGMFNQFAPYGVLANFVVGPIVTLVIMPAVALYFVLLPFGVQAVALKLMALGIQGMLAVAEEIASWPSALLFFPSPPAWAIGCYVLGLCWVCIWQTRMRWLGMVPMLAVLASMPFTKLPDMVVSADARYLAFRTEQGMTLAQGRASSMVPKLLANALGESTLLTLPRSAQQCELGMCIYESAYGRILYQRKYAGELDQCAEAKKHEAVLLVTLRSRLRCPDVFVINANDRRAQGAYALTKTENFWEIETTRDFQGVRPWRAIGF